MSQIEHLDLDYETFTHNEYTDLLDLVSSDAIDRLRSYLRAK